jgi:hypothetical protein
MYVVMNILLHTYIQFVLAIVSLCQTPGLFT